MAYRPLALRCWEAFLTSRGYTHKRTKGSHHQWTKMGSRTIPVWGAEKEIPAYHLKKSCDSVGCTMDELYAWADENC